MELNNCNFTENRASSAGGAIKYDYNLTVNDCTFTNNSASIGGAISSPFYRYFFYEDADWNAVYDDSSLVGYTNINNSKFINNKAERGAVFYHSTPLYTGEEGEDDGYWVDKENNMLYYTDYNKNTISIPLDTPTGNIITITNSEFNDNEAQTLAGVIYLNNMLKTEITDNNFTNNKAEKSGVIFTTNGEVIIKESNFTSNYATSNSTIIQIKDTLVTVEDNIFDSNWVGSSDGWVFTLAEDTKINNNLFVNNTDNKRDMLFDILAGEVRGNIYIDNYLNDTMNTIENSTISDVYEKEINLNLRDVYNDLIRNGTVNVYINDNPQATYQLDVINGKTNLRIINSDLPEKENTITLKYVTLSKHYQNMTTTFKLTKESSNTNITVTANSTVKVGRNVTISGKLFEEDDESKVVSEANIKIMVNGENVKNVTTNSAGEYTYEYTTVKLGEHNVEVVFEKTNDYGASSNNTTFTVIALDTNITINAENVTIGQNTTITGTLYDIDNNISVPNKNLIVRIGDNFINDTVIVDEEGNYKLFYEPTTVGDYTVKITFNSDNENYTSSINTTRFTVKDKIETITDVKIINNTAGNVTLEISVVGADGNESMTGNVEITIDGHNTINLDLTGEKSYKVPLKENITRSGIVGLTVKFTGNNEYYPSNAMINSDEILTKIEVIKQTPTLNLGVLEEPVVNSTIITIIGNLSDDLGNNITDAPVEIFVNDVSIGNVITDSNGAFTIEYPTNKTGENTVKAVYYGYNSRYSNQTDSAVFNVYKLNTTVFLNVSDIEYGQTELINVTVNETGATGQISVDVNSTVEGFRNITYTYSFNGDIISIKVPELYAGVYNVTLKYNGDSIYNGNTTTNSFKVNKNNTYELSVIAHNITYGEEETITVNLPEYTDGIVTINVTGQESRKINITKEKTIVFPAYKLDAGEYEVNISYTDDEYALKTNTTTFKVDKIASNVKVSAENITIGYNETITVTLPEYEHASGKIKVIIYDNAEEKVYEYTIDCPENLENAINITSIPDLTNGTYIVAAEYVDDTNYNNSRAVTEFEVTIPSIKIYDSKEIFIDESAQVHGTVKDNNQPIMEGTIILNVNGTPTIISLEEYEKGYDLTFNKTGVYTVNATYQLFDKEIATSENIYITVNKHNTTINVNELKPVKAGNSTIITGELVDELHRPISGATVVVKVNETIVGSITTDKYGKYSIQFNDTIVGTHNVTSTYDGNDTYIGSEATTTLEVEKIHTKISINPIDDVPLGKEVTITGKLTDEFQEPIKESEVNVTFDGNTQTVKTDNEGNYIATFPTNNIGEKPITVEYGGNNKYTNTTNESKTNVNPKTGKITVEMPENATVNKPTDITGSVTDEEGNPLPNVPVNVTVNGKTYPTTTDENGTFKVPVDNVAVGLNNVTVTVGDENTTAQPVGDKFLGNKQDTNLSIDPVDDVEFGDEVTITGKLADDEGNPIANAPISVIVDNQIVKVTTDDEGNYEANVTTNKLGELPVTVEFKGNEIYNPTETESTINVEPKTATIELVVPREATVNKPAEIYGRVTDKEGNILFDVPVVVTVNGEDYPAVTDENGMYTIEADNVVVGDNNVTVRVVDETISAQPVNDSFTADKQDTELSLEYIEPTTVGDNANIEGQLVDDEGNPIADAPITVTVDGKDYPTTTDENGNYEVLVPVDKVGELPVNVAFAGDDTYNPVNVYSSVLVEPVDAVINVEVPENATVNKPTDITGSVTDEEGNPLPNVPVNVTVNGKTYPTTTDENGTFKVPVDNIVPGTNNLTVTADNENTTAQPVNTKFTATINTNITIDPIDDTLVGENVTISGTLTDEEQNPVKDALVTVTVNGFSKTVKTDEQGKYNVPWPTNNVGKEQVNVEYLGNDKYNSAKADETFNVIKNEGTNSITVPSDAKVGEPASIKGKITDKNGKAVPNMPVNVTVNNKTYKTITDADGNYEIEANNVIEGQNNVTATSGNDKIDVEDVSSTFDARRKDASLTVNPIAKAKVGDNVTITGKLVDEQNNPITNAPVKVTVNDKTYTVVTDEEGNYELTVPNVVEGLNKVNVNYINDEYNTQSTNTTFEASKAKTIVTVPSITGIVGEDITLTAYVTDEDGNPVTGGNLVFKLNGRTLHEDGRFDTDDANPIKFKVQNGIVTYTMKADLYLRAGKNITASYSGSYKYEAAKGNVAEANIKKRTAQVTVSVTPNPAKQNTDIVFTATLDDITRNATNATCLTTDGRVLFKLNGVSLKDAEGNANWVPATHSVVNYVYHVPTGTGGVDENGLKNYTVEAVYDNPAFYPDTKNTSVYHVDRSIVNINFIKTSVTNDVLSVKATFTDYENNYLVGNNKICVKINGKTYQENGKTKYFTVSNGKVDLTGIKLGSGTKVKSVMLVTGDRQAYLSARATTTDITTN